MMLHSFLYIINDLSIQLYVIVILFIVVLIVLLSIVFIVVSYVAAELGNSVI